MQPTTPRLRLINSNQRLGKSVELGDTLTDTITTATSDGCLCCQFYLGGHVGYGCRTIDELDRSRALDYCTRRQCTFYVHVTNIANLAKPDHKTAACTMGVLRKELAIIYGMPAACVLHFGTLGTVEKVAERLNQLREEGYIRPGTHERTPHPLLIENSAGEGSKLGWQWEQFRHLYEALDQSSGVGLCLDTQHSFAAGMCDWQSSEGVVKTFDAAEEVGRGISLIHLNDSLRPYGSRVDRHAPLRQGYIWSQDDTGLRALLDRCFESKLDLVSEGDPAADIELIKRTYLTTRSSDPI